MDQYLFGIKFTLGNLIWRCFCWAFTLWPFKYYRAKGLSCCQIESKGVFNWDVDALKELGARIRTLSLSIFIFWCVCVC